MSRKQGLAALTGAAVGIGVGLVAQRSAVNRRRRNDPEAGEPFGKRRGERSRFIDMPDGGRTFVEETGPEGASKGVVFLHGSALRTDMWHYQMNGFPGRRLIFYDIRGHGLSQPKGASEFTIETLAEDMRRVIEDSDLDEVVVVGHSIGGMAALQLAHDHRDLLGSTLKGIVLANTTHRPAYETVAGGATISKLERVMRHPLDLMGTRHMGVDRIRKIIRPTNSVFMAVSFAAFGPHASAKQIDFTYDMLAETPTDVLFDLFKSYRDFDVTDALGDVTVPVLVITGDHDRITLTSASDYLAQHLPKADLEVLEGCGHMTMLERHRRFNEMLARFLKDTLGNGAEPGR